MIYLYIIRETKLIPDSKRESVFLFFCSFFEKGLEVALRCKPIGVFFVFRLVQISFRLRGIVYFCRSSDDLVSAILYSGLTLLVGSRSANKTSNNLYIP